MIVTEEKCGWVGEGYNKREFGAGMISFCGQINDIWIYNASRVVHSIPSHPCNQSDTYMESISSDICYQTHCYTIRQFNSLVELLCKLHSEGKLRLMIKVILEDLKFKHN